MEKTPFWEETYRSVGLDNGYYIYLLENHGFDDYLFLMRYDNLDDEDILL